MLNKNLKKAQIGQTMTWVVATIVILFILFLFVFVSGSDGFLRSIGAGHFVEDKGSDFAIQQSLFAILGQNDGGIKGLLEKEELDKGEIEEKVGIILDEFEKQGVNCGFQIFEPTGLTFYGKEILQVGRAFTQTRELSSSIILKVNGLDVRLWCIK